MLLAQSGQRRLGRLKLVGVVLEPGHFERELGGADRVDDVLEQLDSIRHELPPDSRTRTYPLALYGDAAS